MPVYCKCCHGEIKSNHDLVVIPSFFRLYPYHVECYGILMKGSDSFLLGQPVNSTRGTFVPFYLLFTYLFLLLFPNFRAQTPIHFISIFLILYATYQRLYSYYKFERNL